mmetsp:Transcript_23254/g.34910  ORF Transcript_23254/g.34910 Transcript_23254/m.34910 type:complete len:206 (-) Transcript_23254:225-842(-)|eukprot:CAMPEP_0116018860 /NCGR_PEP_ID=MMETSP0321-20121206/8892_1 /TAXON_ID=163516 /ORGANISM="Leptocylindrus danicus var. danicus, Strain B650" /LENGTH=205 /DNA_ID=CAMNT_0003489319 /DNA_START=102 /DNA_END=719 /DNA_ORIENTATION=+
MDRRPSNNIKNKLNILDFMLAIGVPLESIDSEGIPMEFFELGKKWAKAAQATQCSSSAEQNYEEQELAHFSQSDAKLVSSLSDECAQIEVQAVNLITAHEVIRMFKEDQPHGELDDYLSDELLMLQEEENLLREELAYVSLESIPYQYSDDFDEGYESSSSCESSSSPMSAYTFPSSVMQLLNVQGIFRSMISYSGGVSAAVGQE